MNQTKHVLISVSDKTGLIPFAKELISLGFEIISTGGTATTLKNAGIPVKLVSEFTGFPEILEGRVKTLHPAIHAGLLYKRGNENHEKQMQDNSLTHIDMVVVNLYPFEETVSKSNISLEEAIENIDIGGPSMLRSAAKNYQSVTVIVNPEKYDAILNELKSHDGETTLETRAQLAYEVYSHTSYYDSLISKYFREEIIKNKEYPKLFSIGLKKSQDLRYGENPHQSAAFYQSAFHSFPSLSNIKQIQGKELSFNNFSDMDAALQCVLEFDSPACVIVKHANPCGVAIGKNSLDAYSKALDADPVSALGGIVALNDILDKESAEKLSKKFLEVIIAPEITDEAKQLLSKKQDLRVVLTGSWKSNLKHPSSELKNIRGGILIQSTDTLLWDKNKIQYVTENKPSDDLLDELKFAWIVVKYLKSNAIAITKENVTCGLGMGQTNRIDAARHAITRAGEKTKGAVLASDAFFPFDDVVREAAKAGIKAIIQPGGSKRDQDSINACNELGITMVFTGIRHFRH